MRQQAIPTRRHPIHSSTSQWALHCSRLKSPQLNDIWGMKTSGSRVGEDVANSYKSSIGAQSRDCGLRDEMCVRSIREVPDYLGVKVGPVLILPSSQVFADGGCGLRAYSIRSLHSLPARRMPIKSHTPRMLARRKPTRPTTG